MAFKKKTRRQFYEYNIFLSAKNKYNYMSFLTIELMNTCVITFNTSNNDKIKN